jgi:hypothetical protein
VAKTANSIAAPSPIKGQQAQRPAATRDLSLKPPRGGFHLSERELDELAVGSEVHFRERDIWNRDGCTKCRRPETFVSPACVVFETDGGRVYTAKWISHGILGMVLEPVSVDEAQRRIRAGVAQ